MPETTISDVMAAYATDAVAHAHERGFTLDYSEASLANVDLVLGKVTASGLLLPKSAEEESAVWTLSKQYGGYVGEVVIRQIGGSWEMHDLPDGSARVILRSSGVQMFPLEKIHKRLIEDEHSGLSGYCRALRMIIQRKSSK
jgi:hypothetical protein